MILILLVLFLFVFPLGGNYYNGGAYRGYGFGLGGILLLVLLFLVLTHSTYLRL